MVIRAAMEVFSRVRWSCVCLLPALVVGCSSSDPTATVHGQVSVGGKPVGPGIVILQPDGPATEPPRKMTTLKFGADGKFTGEAPLGKHQVMIQSDEYSQESEQPSTTKNPIPEFYADSGVNQLSADVKDGDNKLDFDLKPR
jgi:hypothetical protein